MADTLVQRLVDKDFANLKDDIETVIANKIVKRINDKKEELFGKKDVDEDDDEKKLNKEVDDALDKTKLDDDEQS